MCIITLLPLKTKITGPNNYKKKINNLYAQDCYPCKKKNIKYALECYPSKYATLQNVVYTQNQLKPIR